MSRDHLAHASGDAINVVLAASSYGCGFCPTQFATAPWQSRHVGVSGDTVSRVKGRIFNTLMGAAAIAWPAAISVHCDADLLKSYVSPISINVAEDLSPAYAFDDEFTGDLS